MKKNLKRRDFIKKAGLAGAAATAVSTFAAPAIAAGHQEWIICSAFGKAGLLGQAIQSFADNINSYTDKLKIKVYHAGELVPGLESLDAVRSGAAQASYGAPYYWTNLSDAIEFVATCPFGMNAMEQNAWCYYGGGIEEADKIYNALGLKFLPMGNTGNQMGGWFNKEINSTDDLKGLKMRIPGLGGMMMSKLGVSVVGVPGSQIYENLVNGTIDATEWVGPWNDERSRFYEAAKYYYWPGVHEPGTVITLGTNKSWFTSLSKTDQMIIEHAATVQNELMLTEYNAMNGAALKRLVNDQGVELREFNEDVIDAMGEASQDLYEELAEGNELTGRILASFKKSRDEISSWLNLADNAFTAQRNRVLGS